MRKLILKSKIKAKDKLIKPNYRYDPWKDGVSQSMLQTKMDCSEKARLATILGWTPTNHSKPMTWGDLWHEAQALYFLNLKDSKRKILGSNNLVKEVPHWINETEFNWVTRQNKTPTTDEKDLVADYLAEIEMMLPHYIKYWFKDDTAVKWLFVEDKFKITIDKHLPPLVGKFDRVSEYKGKIILNETKTKGKWSDRIMDWLPLDLQLGTYITALPHLLKKQATEIKYDIIRRPQERRKVNESRKDFIKRIEERIVKEPQHYFERFKIELDKNDIAMHLDRTHELVYNYLDWFENMNKKGLLCYFFANRFYKKHNKP